MPILTLSLLPNIFPDPYYTIRRIRKMYQYIDINNSIRINKVPSSRINSMMLVSVKNSPSFEGPDIIDIDDPSFFFCFSVFHHIYLNEYREYDFTSFDNFQILFVDFQRFLWEISEVYKFCGRNIREKLPDIKIFDLKNMSENIDVLIRWKIERKISLKYYQ